MILQTCCIYLLGRNIFSEANTDVTLKSRVFPYQLRYWRGIGKSVMGTCHTVTLSQDADVTRDTDSCPRPQCVTKDSTHPSRTYVFSIGKLSTDKGKFCEIRSKEEETFDDNKH